MRYLLFISIDPPEHLRKFGVGNSYEVREHNILIGNLQYFLNDDYRYVQHEDGWDLTASQLREIADKLDELNGAK
jgi:hypothetical protein